ncbi:MAG: phosphatidylserine decarboxylase [Pseudomonadota bacterium]|nr:MAG: phosphatidylserine decarboxylase [Pseudomonadota bacterium]
MESVSRYPILAREGWGHCAVVAVPAVLVTWMWGWVWAAPLWLATIFVVQFFRDPVRSIPSAPGTVVCPADGRVIVVDEVDDPYLKRRAKRVSIFMNVFNVHSNRMPVGGVVKERWYHAGSYFNAALDKAAHENERNALWVQTTDQHDIVVVQVAGLIARRILCYVAPGRGVERGERYGFIRFGSRVDVYLPLTATVKVALGDKVHGASGVLAELHS